MTKPLLSIVVPVKINSGTLEYTIRTILAQDYPNIQIVISDGSNQVEVRDLVKQINDKRIKCITPYRTDSGFSNDWEFALSGADGEYVTFLGDDDGVLPKAYSLAMEYILNHNVDAFTWKKINYNWPDHLLSEYQNMLIGDSKPEIQRINAKKSLKLLSQFKVGYNSLPCIYNSIVCMSDIRSVIKKSKKNRFFSGSIPDLLTASSIAQPAILGALVLLKVPR